MFAVYTLILLFVYALMLFRRIVWYIFQNYTFQKDYMIILRKNMVGIFLAAILDYWRPF